MNDGGLKGAVWLHSAGGGVWRAGRECETEGEGESSPVPGQAEMVADQVHISFS